MTKGHASFYANLPPQKCERCGYDLRGSSSGVCPECGNARDTVPISISDSVQFHTARAALERDGLLVRASQPGGTLGTLGIVHGLPNQDGYLWVAAHALDRVEQCLDEAGVASSLNARPIVDKSEPVCPRCEAALDANGPETCPQCDANFHWVEIEEPEIDSTGRLCHACRYELTGNVSGLCPECGIAILPPAPEQFVEAATHHPQAPADEPRAYRFNVSHFLKSTTAIVILLALTFATISKIDSDQQILSLEALWGFIILAAVSTLGFVAWQSFQEMQD